MGSVVSYKKSTSYRLYASTGKTKYVVETLALMTPTTHPVVITFEWCPLHDYPVFCVAQPPNIMVNVGVSVYVVCTPATFCYPGHVYGFRSSCRTVLGFLEQRRSIPVLSSACGSTCIPVLST